MQNLFRHLYLPYCLDQQPDGRYAVLNRHYKPLGMPGGKWVNYADHPECLVALKGLTPLKAKKISARGEPGTDRIYLYNDGCQPDASAGDWAAYAARLNVLQKLEAGEADA